MQRLEIVARACELIVRPNETPEDGKTTRTIEELMDEVIRRGIVPDINWSSVQRILAGLEVKPSLTRRSSGSIVRTPNFARRSPRSATST